MSKDVSELPPIGEVVEVLDRHDRVITTQAVLAHGPNTYRLHGGWTFPRSQRWRAVPPSTWLPQGSR